MKTVKDILEFLDQQAKEDYLPVARAKPVAVGTVVQHPLLANGGTVEKIDGNSVIIRDHKTGKQMRVSLTHFLAKRATESTLQDYIALVEARRSNNG